MPNHPYITDDDTIRCRYCCSLWGSDHAEWCQYAPPLNQETPPCPITDAEAQPLNAEPPNS